MNYVAVAGVLDIPPPLVGAGLAADNLMCACYFAAIFYLARSAEQPKQDTAAATAAATAAVTAAAGGTGGAENDDVILAAEGSGSFSVLKASYALSLAAVVCAVSAFIAQRIVPGGGGLEIPIITLVTVFLATVAAKPVGKLAPSGEAGGC